MSENLEQRLTAYIENYEFRGDNGDYQPTEQERTLLEDALHGWVSEEAEHAQQAREPKPVALTQAEIDSVVKDANLYHYMLSVAKANGFDSLTDAITRARKSHPPKADPDVVRLVGALKEAIESNINHHHIRSRDSYCDRVEEYDTIKRWRTALAPFSALSGEG